MSDRADSAKKGDEQDSPADRSQADPIEKSAGLDRLEPDSATIEIALPLEDDVLSAIETSEDAFGILSVRAVSESDGTGEVTAIDIPPLTDKQLSALQAAHINGYFERPREQSATEIADSLGVSHSTFLRHLRTAQRKIFEFLLD